MKIITTNDYTPQEKIEPGKHYVNWEFDLETTDGPVRMKFGPKTARQLKDALAGWEFMLRDEVGRPDPGVAT